MRNKLDHISLLEKVCRMEKKRFDRWFSEECPAEQLISAIDASCECHVCPHNTGLTFRNRCSILNQRRKYENLENTR